MALVEREVTNYAFKVTGKELIWQQLAAGDKVAVVNSRSYYGAEVTLFTVERVTATLVIMEGGSRWYRNTGKQVASNSWDKLRHPQDDAVINGLEEAETRRFKRRLEELAKGPTTGYAQMDTLILEVKAAANLYASRINALEGQRRVE